MPDQLATSSDEEDKEEDEMISGTSTAHDVPDYEEDEYSTHSTPVRHLCMTKSVQFPQRDLTPVEKENVWYVPLQLATHCNSIQI